MAAKLVRRIKISDEVKTVDQMICYFCLVSIGYTTSTLGKVVERVNRVRHLNPSSVGNPIHYLTSSGEVMNVDTVKFSRVPTFKVVRACPQCVGKLDEITIQDSDHSKEPLWAEHSHMGFGKG